MMVTWPTLWVQCKVDSLLATRVQQTIIMTVIIRTITVWWLATVQCTCTGGQSKLIVWICGETAVILVLMRKLSCWLLHT